MRPRARRCPVARSGLIDILRETFPLEHIAREDARPSRAVKQATSYTSDQRALRREHHFRSPRPTACSSRAAAFSLEEALIQPRRIRSTVFFVQQLFPSSARSSTFRRHAQFAVPFFSNYVRTRCISLSVTRPSVVRNDDATPAERKTNLWRRAGTRR